MNTLSDDVKYLKINDDNGKEFNIRIYKDKDKDDKKVYLDIDELSHIFNIDIKNIIDIRKTIDTDELLYTEDKYYKQILNNNNLKIYFTLA
jgi:hypothetical protein